MFQKYSTKGCGYFHLDAKVHLVHLRYILTGLALFGAALNIAKPRRLKAVFVQISGSLGSRFALLRSTDSGLLPVYQIVQCGHVAYFLTSCSIPTN
jgi:hypothetical protein